MPPKNKKQAEEEAKRLEQERRIREQEEARIEAERQKYLPKCLSSGLFLPASGQLITDFSKKPIDFVTQKLKQGFQQFQPSLLNSQRISFIFKQLQYFIKDSLTLFGQVQQGANTIKHQIFIGILFALLLNNDSEGKGNIKSKQEDQSKARQLVTVHCRKLDGQVHLTKEEGLTILRYAKQRYFSKFLLIQNFDKFTKRHSTAEFPIYIQTPSVYVNTKQTVFTDLLKHSEQPPLII